jgi:peptide-methionine (S)-S-oxide reductase
MPYTFSALDRIARSSRYQPTRLPGILEGPADKGLVIDFCFDDGYQYMPSPLFIGIFEFTMMRAAPGVDSRKLGRLFHEYLCWLRSCVRETTPAFWPGRGRKHPVQVAEVRGIERPPPTLEDTGRSFLPSISTVRLVLAVLLTASAGAAPGTAPVHATATFAGGCFWCMEPAFAGLPGVLSVTSGYTGGQQQAPTYQDVSAGTTGHAEAVQVVYDPAKIGYAQVLQAFWHNIDPLSANGQFCDRGTQYRSAIFYHDDGQRKAAEESKQKLEERSNFKGRIVTPIVAAQTFYPAEEYHQHFYRKNPERYHEYRRGCGRDRRLKELWGESAGGHR